MSSYHNQAIAYRSEIDGLRALAVLPVIFFHAGFDLFSGGYVGVDIFFVISGYLITSIILREMELGDFSIVRFYERRARRILPALFFVIICCIPFAWVWMQPDELKKFGQSLVAVATFSSNIFFWRNTDYFAPAAEEQPLLHTWSLAVEEQYYLLLPLFFTLCWRYGKPKVFWLTMFAAGLSLCLAELGSRHQPMASFYLLPTRAWELLAGSLIAFIPRVMTEKTQSKTYAQIFPTIGFLIIIYAFFFFDNDTPTPSLYTAVPVIGTMLIITFAHQKTGVGAILSIKPVVTIGLISYSAYLWHQPIFAFIRLRDIIPPSSQELAFGIIFTLIMAYITYRCVELPVRKLGFSDRNCNEQAFNRKRKTFYYSLVSLLIISFSGLIVNNLVVSKSSISSVEKVIDENRPKCKTNPNSIFPNCVYGDEKLPVLMVLGDSHAENLLPVLYSDKLINSNYRIVQATYPGCIPVPSIVRLNRAGSEHCALLLQKAKSFIQESKDLRIIVLARWPLYLTGDRFQGKNGGHEEGDKVLLESEDGKYKNGNDEFIEFVAENFVNLVGNQAQVYWISPIPEVGLNVQRIFARKVNHALYEPYLQDIEQRERSSLTLLNKVQRRLVKPLVLVDSKEVLCSRSSLRCRIIDDTPLYVDTNHLSREGAQLLLPLIRTSLGIQLTINN